jgi:hypothetical protein
MPKLARRLLRLPKLLVALVAAALALSTIQAKPLNVPVVYYKLPNGLKVVISEDHVAPVVIRIFWLTNDFRKRFLANTLTVSSCLTRNRSTR